jgi:hypothetical protein
MRTVRTGSVRNVSAVRTGSVRNIITVRTSSVRNIRTADFDGAHVIEENVRRLAVD